ncbi:MAG: iron-only hydrogenase system regulator [Halanaerobiaceae bacterium]|jgi:putative iron-only hydrogenase system regulator|nr:iron-only hydrogenase system regulator [Halanaerobiaceae bacterium]
MEEKIAVIGAVLDNPRETQNEFNDIVAEYRNLVRGRIGIPLLDKGISAIALIVIGSLDEINSLTGKLGKIDGVNVKTSISKKEI